MKNFIPKPGAASLYVYRKDSVPGFATMEVHVNGHSIGRIADKTFLYVELPPGRHVVTGQSGDTRISGVEIDMRPGKLYYVKQTSQFGGLRASGSVLVRVDDIEAQHAIRKTSLAVGPP